MSETGLRTARRRELGSHVNDVERDLVSAQFGDSAEQVERNHLISHLLAFLNTSIGDQVQFIGGTALACTPPTGPLGEDIDLIAIDDRKPVAAILDAAPRRALSRSHGRLTLEPALGSIASSGWVQRALPRNRFKLCFGQTSDGRK